MSERILVRGVNWIGDAVMMMPALRALRKAWPGSCISLLAKPPVPSLFERDPGVDEIIPYDERFKGFTGKIKLASILRRKGFSKAVLFQNAFDAALITFLAGIPERIGYRRDGRGFLLTRPVPFDGDDRKLHHTDYYLGLLKAAGMHAEYVEPWIYLVPDERISARARLSGLGRPVLGINPGATYGSAKRWFPERFAEVANWFIRDTGGSVVIFGGKNEKDIAGEIDYLIKKESGTVPLHPPLTKEGVESSLSKGAREGGSLSVLDLAGKTTLRELVSLVSECDVLVTNDSGPMHIAYAVGTPFVAIFGSTAPELTGYGGDRCVTIKHSFDCSPCFERTCGTGDMKCMYSITSDDVYLGIKKLLPERKAVFFDRDGTLCRDAGYLNAWSDFKIFPEVEGLNVLKKRGFALIGVSNQSGIARGIVDESFVKDVNRVFLEKYGFDDFYYCPHHPDEKCSCRKPEPGMLVSARAKHRINLKASYIVGDKDADMVLARAVGARGIFVKTGRQNESPHADFVTEDLREVVNLILSHEQA